MTSVVEKGLSRLLTQYAGVPERRLGAARVPLFLDMTGSAGNAPNIVASIPVSLGVSSTVDAGFSGAAPYAYWKMNTLSGGQVPDSAPGGTHPLTVTALGSPAASVVSGGVEGNRLRVNGDAGQNKLISTSVIPDSGVSSAGSWTLCGWFESVANIQAPTFGDYTWIVQSTGGGTGVRFGCALYPVAGDGSTFKVYSAAGTGDPDGYSAGTRNINTRYFFCQRKTPTQIINSINDETANTINVVGAISPTLEIAHHTQNHYFNGYLDEIAFWNVAISDAERLELYQRGLAGKAIIP